MINAISSQNNFLTSSSVSDSSASSSTLTENFDTFLTLLTTQLTNQDPMEPMGVSEFTQQLTEFASIEQSIKQTEQNALALSLNKSSTALQYMNMVGKQVSFSGSISSHSGEGANWSINVNSYAPNSKVGVFDASGNEIYSEEIALDQGSNSFAWNGRTSTGSIAPTGDYELRIEAHDAQDNLVGSSMQSSGIVDGVDFSSADPKLKIGDSYYGLSSIISFGSV